MQLPRAFPVLQDSNHSPPSSGPHPHPMSPPAALHTCNPQTWWVTRGSQPVSKQFLLPFLPKQSLQDIAQCSHLSEALGDSPGRVRPPLCIPLLSTDHPDLSLCILQLSQRSPPVRQESDTSLRPQCLTWGGVGAPSRCWVRSHKERKGKEGGREGSGGREIGLLLPTSPAPELPSCLSSTWRVFGWLGNSHHLKHHLEGPLI